MKFKYLFLLFCLCLHLNAAIGEKKNWEANLTLLGFFEENLIPPSLYYNLSSQDKELCAEVKLGTLYYVLRNENSDLLQALIPISDSIQIHIFKVKDEFRLNFIPIISFPKERVLGLKIQNSPYQDIKDITNDILLATEFANIYKRSHSNRVLYKNDTIALNFTRSYRLGRPFGIPNIKAAMIESNNKPQFAFLHSNGQYYDKNGKEMAGFTLETPVRYSRISSRFSKGRKHPILNVIRPHYGVDYVAPTGTPIFAAASGRVIFAGVKGGYGKVVEIQHEGGIKTLYAHMSAILTKSGSFVKVGSMIGRVGTTGVSTGPHLHFGVYKFNQPVNPLARIRTTKSELKGKEKNDFLKVAQIYETNILESLNKQWENNHILVSNNIAINADEEFKNEDLTSTESKEEQ